MAGSTGGTGSSNPSSAPPPPKILLAKPGLVTGGPVAGKFGRGGATDDETASLRSRLPSIGSLNLLSDSWDFHIDRFLPSVFSPSVLAEIMRPDGSSTISVLGGESLSAELAHELMSIQLGVILASICNVLLVVSEGVHDYSMWRLMLTVDLLKHGIPDPSSILPSHSQSSNLGPEKENKDKVHKSEEYMAAPVFVHTKLDDQDLSPRDFSQLRKAILHYFNMSSFMRDKSRNMSKGQPLSSMASGMQSNDPDFTWPDLFVIPRKSKDDFPRAQYESYFSTLCKLRDQVLSMNCPPFARTVSERDWLKNSAKIWELVKTSPVIAEYSRTLQSSGLSNLSRR
ncbi:uncharacterized protein LOC133852315 isoform X2 [Alnus glutinosa]|uniref:uncharacterized protein LOC133852315 isoform X2 n=1 Tax=Alnus glutinosa TaxID=3517 RepID=UPI002D78D80F|nr:uncharacterized protein LOC133852315 isoform X2 [Alnus glutinosa]